MPVIARQTADSVKNMFLNQGPAAYNVVNSTQRFVIPKVPYALEFVGAHLIVNAEIATEDIHISIGPRQDPDLYWATTTALGDLGLSLPVGVSNDTWLVTPSTKVVIPANAHAMCHSIQRAGSGTGAYYAVWEFRPQDEIPPTLG